MIELNNKIDVRRSAMSDLSLEECYILYVDLLGYKAIMNEMPEKEFLKIIDRSYREVKKDLEIMSRLTHSNSVFDYKLFSDNIVVATKADSAHALYSLSYIAYYLQRDFIEKGIICRGAITKGQLYISAEYVFGSGLIRAYELENRVAFYPRIILDRLPEVNSVLDNYTDSFFYHDSDGYVIIDYLRIRDMGNTKNSLLTLHKQFVESRIVKHSANERVYQKYAWCREYHNSVCNRFDLSGWSI